MRICIILSLIFCSCNNDIKTLANSTGKSSEVIFVVDDNFWINSLDSLASDVFASPIQGISKPEPLFKIIQINNREFKSILKSHKNIIIVSKDTQKTQYFYDKWAEGQFVAFLFETKDNGQLNRELKDIRSVLLARELNTIKRRYSLKSKKKIEAELRGKFGVDFIIPDQYQIALNEKKIFWANYDPLYSDEIINLFVFSFVSQTTNLQSEILYMTDSIFNKYLEGEPKNSFVQIEKNYPPYFSNDMFRGLWRLEGGFMGGPFIIKFRLIEDRVVVSAGMVFSPNSHKRKYIKDFEAIL